MNKAVGTFFLFLSIPFFTFAMPSKLDCKLYDKNFSAQMSSRRTSDSAGTKTFLTFNNPISWYPDLLSFELVYSSGYNAILPLTVVGNSIASNGIPQTVQITLNAPPAGESTRYGTVRVGDFRGEWYSTTAKHKTYDIQCYNF